MINSSWALYASTKTASRPTPAPSASGTQTLHASNSSKSSLTGQTLHDWYPQRLGVQGATPPAGSRGSTPRRQDQISTPKPTQKCMEHTILAFSSDLTLFLAIDDTSPFLWHHSLLILSIFDLSTLFIFILIQTFLSPFSSDCFLTFFCQANSYLLFCSIICMHCFLHRVRQTLVAKQENSISLLSLSLSSFHYRLLGEPF